ncbi:MAG: response regulator [Candidatus Omnitrophica bacterium]|nr:response regulator [Candidatus Omnitrophota bacterium]MDE2008704.1 response regulator [Candidatus Omnitrophota bacterium]
MSQIILVVDDDRSIVHTLKSILLKNGFEVLTANNGEEALKLIKTNRPDMVITDLMMPVMDGWYLSMNVRRDPRFKKTPIIVISGILNPEAVQQDPEASTFYVPKPFAATALMEKIKEIFISRRNP